MITAALIVAGLALGAAALLFLWWTDNATRASSHRFDQWKAHGERMREVGARSRALDQWIDSCRCSDIYEINGRLYIRHSPPCTRSRSVLRSTAANKRQEK